MGVYISNETMPEDCYTCFCYETEFNMCSLTGKRLDNIRIRQDDCPLIETDDELIKKLQESAIVIKAVFNRLKKVVNNSDELKTELMGTNPNLTIFDECVESVEK